MPELPEVETLVRSLQPAVGRTIFAAEVLDRRLGVLPESLAGRTVQRIARRAKYIVIELDGRGDLVVHLRMSGRLRLDRSEREAKYTRMILHLDSGDAVYFVDPRRLGTVDLHPCGFEKPLGIDPTTPQFTTGALATLAAASRSPIKQLLLDQRKIAGIGNIYAAETLWWAGIDPRRPARTLTTDEIAALYQAIGAVLADAIRQLGTTLGGSVSDYRTSATKDGSFQNALCVYGQKGLACRRCGAQIERVIQAGRSTYCCPSCQT